MSPSSVAVLAGVSPAFAFRLLNGRGGRPLRRINPETARKLLRVTAEEARAVRRRPVPARATVQHLHRLRADGWSDVDLAQLLAVSPGALRVLLSEGNGSCTQLGALRAAAEVSLLLTPLPVEPVAARTAA